MDQLALNLIGGGVGLAAAVVSILIVLRAKSISATFSTEKMRQNGRRNRAVISPSVVTMAGVSTMIGGLLMVGIALLGGFGTR